MAGQGERAERVAVTGTPGTGKTSATERLAAEGFEVTHLNDAIREADLHSERDEERDSLVADFAAIEEWLGDWSGLLESHLAHHFDAERVVVLRCRPDVLKTRLLDRGESPAKASENAESEALDVILSEAVDRHGEDAVYEIDTTDRDPEAVAEAIRAVIAGERDPSAGTVDFLEYL
jgi:adenylate kinase